MRRIKVFVSGILAGISIALGGTVFLSVDSRIFGAVAFTVGLFAVCTMGFHLFTGKVCYVFDNDRDFALDLPVMWLGNLAGAFAVAQMELATRIGPTIGEKSREICQLKLDDNLLSIFILAFFCNVLIYVAVEGYGKNPHELGKYLALFFGVVVFILCGFEHCVANMYYFSVAELWSGKTLLYVIVMTLGNGVGGIALPLLRKAAAAKKKQDMGSR